MKQYRTILQAAVTAAAVYLAAGCSPEKNTGASRFYNSLISKYNVYFNGNEAYKAGVEKVKTSHRDDYNTILPVFEYTAPESARAAASDMERAAQKASKVISLYSITAQPQEKEKGSRNDRGSQAEKRREYNEWVDDSYLLLAKAQFYMKNLTASRAALSFATGISTDPDLTAEATIWLARVQTEERNYSEATRIIQGMGSPESYSKGLRTMIYSTTADIALRQKRYSEAIAPLSLAVENSGDKHARVRWTYLLAQTCGAAGDFAASTRYYRQVIKMNPPYNLEFAAGINLAGVTDISADEADDLRKTLHKMLRNAKNQEYLDQIYYAMGQLEHRMGNDSLAVDLWSESVRNSINNNRQKARSYIALGQHFFSLPDYMTSWHYYDSALFTVDDRFPGYDELGKRTTDLGDYARFHTVVVTEDSLRMVAMMTDAERDALITSVIDQLKQQRASGERQNGSDRYNMGVYYENEQRYQGAISAEGGWYFYNQAAMTFGRSEFRRRWGERRLEDNWRRSNKARTSFAFANASENEVQKNTTDSTGTSADLTKEYYLSNLPLTDSLFNVSLTRSAESLLGEARILAERIGDTASAVTSFELAAARGNPDRVRAEALFDLYRLLKSSDPPRAEMHRTVLLSAFPESEYALILSDPDYVNKQLEAARKAERSYMEAYDAFRSERYADASRICSRAVTDYPGDLLVPKFMLLDAMATGAVSGEMAYKQKLDSLTARFPETSEGKRAAEIAEFLRKEIPQLRVAEDTQIAQEIYSYNAGDPHFVMIVARNTGVNLNQMIFDVINYNLDNFRDKNFRTEGITETTFLLVTVGVFGNAAEAEDWIKSFSPDSVIREASMADISVYVISTINLDRLRQDKNIDRYAIFYGREYVGEGR